MGLLYRGTALADVVAEQPGAAAWAVSADGTEVRRRARDLGALP